MTAVWSGPSVFDSINPGVNRIGWISLLLPYIEQGAIYESVNPYMDGTAPALSTSNSPSVWLGEPLSEALTSTSPDHQELAQAMICLDIVGNGWRDLEDPEAGDVQATMVAVVHQARKTVTSADSSEWLKLLAVRLQAL